MRSEPNDLLFKDAGFSYANGFALNHINLLVPNGQLMALLGPNGSGKTTLLRLATGVLVPSEGDISIGGASLKKLLRKTIARRIAVVPQDFNIPFAYTVEEVVLLGRTPFIHNLTGESKRDWQIVSFALELTGMADFRNRYFNDLSGGERQKVVLAMALAQEPTLLLLDEPTSHLDINHQVEILELIRKLNREKKVTVIAAMHDLNLATLYFERLVLLDHGLIFADGSPDEVITKEIIQKVFSTKVEIARHPKTSVPQIVLLLPDIQLNNG
jgi:iron complex transport system ATP-binding protein